MPASPAPPPSASPPRARWLVALLAGMVALLAAVGYAGTLRGYFQGDDFGFVGFYFDFPLSDWPGLFLRGWADGLWSSSYRELRPLNALAFILDARLWGLEPAGFRLTNLTLHATSSLLVGLIAWRASRRDAATAAIAAALFAVHPVNAHAVAWITGRVDVLSTAFFLAAFLGFLSQRETPRGAWLALLAVGQAGALFTKESGVTLIGFLVAADLIWLRPSPRARSTWLPYAICGGVLLGYFTLRWIAFGSGSPGGIGRGMPDLVTSATYLELLRRETAYVAHLLPPLQPWLVAWRDAGYAVTPVRLAQAAFVMAAALTAVLGVWRWRARTPLGFDRRGALFFGCAWFVLATVPLMATYFSARHLYLAAPGLCIAVALLLRGALPRQAVRLAAAAVLVLLLVGQLWQTLGPWRRGAELSREIAHHVRAAAERVPQGGALLVDVPALTDGAFCWSWALPYAIRPPFASTAEPLLLQAPGNYAFSSGWRRPEVFARLAALEGDALLVVGSPRGELQTLTLPAAKVRAAARGLEAGNARDATVLWGRFLTALQER